MTKKDYRMIANILRVSLTGMTLEATAHRFADELEKDNPRFRRDVFFAACGVIDFSDVERGAS